MSSLKPPASNPSPKPSTAPQATLTGTCPCGSISITVESDHSLASKQHSQPNLIIDASKTALQDRRNTLKMYFDLDMMSGQQIEKFICSSCGSPILSTTALLPGRVNLTMGLSPLVPASGFEVQGSKIQAQPPHKHPIPC
ncbi:hypothetical protein BJX99DRAFT_218077 [Aspergillus californicus]